MRSAIQDLQWNSVFVKTETSQPIASLLTQTENLMFELTRCTSFMIECFYFYIFRNLHTFYHPPTKLREGSVFGHVTDLTFWSLKK